MDDTGIFDFVTEFDFLLIHHVPVSLRCAVLSIPSGLRSLGRRVSGGADHFVGAPCEGLDHSESRPRRHSGDGAGDRNNGSGFGLRRRHQNSAFDKQQPNVGGAARHSGSANPLLNSSSSAALAALVVDLSPSVTLSSFNERGNSPFEPPASEFAGPSEDETGLLDVIAALAKQEGHQLLSFLDADALREASRFLEKNVELAPNQVLFGDVSSRRGASAGAPDASGEAAAKEGDHGEWALGIEGSEDSSKRGVRNATAAVTPCDGSLYFIRQGSMVLSIAPLKSAGLTTSSDGFGEALHALGGGGDKDVDDGSFSTELHQGDTVRFLQI